MNDDVAVLLPSNCFYRVTTYNDAMNELSRTCRCLHPGLSTDVTYLKLPIGGNNRFRYISMAAISVVITIFLKSSKVNFAPFTFNAAYLTATEVYSNAPQCV